MKNIILITVDALRADLLSSYGSKIILTPFIDSLVSNSIIFSNVYSTGPYTQASFQGILASQYYLEYGKEKKLNVAKILISELLKESGIFTAGFHSNAYLSNYFGYNRGWEVFYDSMSDSVTDLYPFIRGNQINKKVAGFLNNFSFSKSLFLWVHYMDVHEPYIAEESYLTKIDSGIGLSKEDMFALFKNVLLPRDISDAPTLDVLKKLYMAKVTETDDYIKELFYILDSHNLLSSSTIIVTSDHGDEFAEHGGLSHDGKMYNELLLVPLIIYDISYCFESINIPVSLIDLSPTICSMFKVKPSPSFKGNSLYPLKDIKPYAIYGEAMGKLGNKEKDTNKPVYYLMENNQKIIYKEDEQAWEAYDLSSDSGEKNDLYCSLDQDKKEKLTRFIKRAR